MPTILSRRSGSSGGSLPSWWTVDSTPGSESVEFAGRVEILGNVGMAPGDELLVVTNDSTDGVTVLSVDHQGLVSLGYDSATALLQVRPDISQVEIVAGGKILVAGDELGFFDAGGVTKPTGVAVSAAGIHAALVSLGLIAA